MDEPLPLIGITMGDPSGIGPEIILKALENGALYQVCRPVILGDPAVLEHTRTLPGIGSRGAIKIHTVSSTRGAGENPGVLDCVPISDLKPGSFDPGRPTEEGGKAMVAAIARAVDMAQNLEIEAMATGPISKALMHRAGFPYEGHTQLIAHLTGTSDVVMMLAGPRLRVVLATIHCALKEVPGLLSIDGLCKTLHITARALQRDFGRDNPCLAVAALNPHAGEEGLFGTEEDQVIRPAMERARAAGHRVEGPFPADTLFPKAASGQFDAVVAMYHDQGLIPLKLLHFSQAVNVTLGLPILRTSVDHGTAYDIAGKGQAHAGSLQEAIRMAASMAINRRGQSAGRKDSNIEIRNSKPR